MIKTEVTYVKCFELSFSIFRNHISNKIIKKEHKIKMN